VSVAAHLETTRFSPPSHHLRAAIVSPPSPTSHAPRRPPPIAIRLHYSCVSSPRHTPRRHRHSLIVPYAFRLAVPPRLLCHMHLVPSTQVLLSLTVYRRSPRLTRVTSLRSPLSLCVLVTLLTHPAQAWTSTPPQSHCDPRTASRRVASCYVYSFSLSIPLLTMR
jgi:hypothetical protein